MAADAGAGSHREMAKRPCESTRTFPRTLESQCPSTLLYKVAVESTGKWRSGNSHGHPHLSALLHQRRRRHGLHLYMLCMCVSVCMCVHGCVTGLNRVQEFVCVSVCMCVHGCVTGLNRVQEFVRVEGYHIAFTYIASIKKVFSIYKEVF